MMFRPAPRASTLLREGALDYEIAREQAAALGRMGRELEKALAALAEHERTHAGIAAALGSPRSRARAALVHKASYALWCFIVQREACGLRDARLIIREYGVPAEVRNRIGVLPTK